MLKGELQKMNCEKDYYKYDLKYVEKKDVVNFLIAILGIVVTNLQLYGIARISEKLNIGFIILDIIINLIIIYYTVEIYIRSLKIKKMTKCIEMLDENNKSLTELNDNIRSFKHDFYNIMQAIDGYILVGDMEALKGYFSKLMQECNHMKNLELLTYKQVSNPAIYGVLLNKYRKAEQKSINMNIDVLMDFKEISDKSYCLSRILGILLDNAIEAAIECEDKNINLQFSQECSNRRKIIIENTYNNKNVDTNRIFEKNYTTKDRKNNSGLGLWKVRNMLDKESGIELSTTKDKDMFKQQLEIYI